MQLIDSAIWWTGAAVISYGSLRLLLQMLRFIHGFCLGPGVDFKSFGKYAVITGSTDGIGKAYAFELAARGINLVLLSRTESRLKETAEAIKCKHQVEVKTIAADFTKADIYSTLEEQLKSLDIGILINNVGMSSHKKMLFWEYDPKFIMDTINCNFLSAVMMCRLVMPAFLRKSKGIIINVSSTAGDLPGALGALYTPTKKAEQIFSEALLLESALATSGIVVQDVAPCFVATKLSRKTEQPFHVLSPENYVRSAINTIGRMNITTGCMSHEFERLVVNAIPRSFLGRVVLQSNLQQRAFEDEKDQ